MLRLLRSKNGSATVLLVGLFPVLVMLLAFLVNIIVMIDHRISLHAAVDRGVYAGASHLSYLMNEVAILDKKFRDEYLAKESAFRRSSEDNSEYIKKQVDEMKNNQSVHYEEMMDIVDNGYKNARDIAIDVIKKNLENKEGLELVEYKPMYGLPSSQMFELVNDYDEDGRILNKENLRAVEIEGNSFDPNRYKEHQYEAYKYLIKDGSYVAIASEITALYKPPIMQWFFDDIADNVDGIAMSAAAAAQPTGGSLKAYAHASGDPLEFTYHPVFVPLEVVWEITNAN